MRPPHELPGRSRWHGVRTRRHACVIPARQAGPPGTKTGARGVRLRIPCASPLILGIATHSAGRIMPNSDAAAEGPHPVDRHVGRRLADIRIERGHSQTELGKALGLTFQQVQKYEKGTNRISASKLWIAADFLGVEISYFFEDLTRGSPIPGPEERVVNGVVTRSTLELTRLLSSLPPPQQRLLLDLARQLNAGNQNTAPAAA